MTKNLTDKNFWDKNYGDYKFSPMELDYPITEELYKFFNANQQKKSVFEVGCFPGRFLYHFWKMGYQLNGVDQTDYLSWMKEWLAGGRFEIGNISQWDFFENDFWKFDVVFSTGFIEHFTNFEEVIELHMGFVKTWGHVCITVPNFSGSIQKFLHERLDRSNLEMHYLPSMDLEAWRRVAERNGFEVCVSKYIGGFGFWIASDWLLYKIIAKIIRILFCWKFLPNAKSYSPELFFIAKKK